MEKEHLQLNDVETFMGIRAKDFVSQNAQKIHPSFDAFDKLRIVATAASALDYGEPNLNCRQQDTREQFFNRLTYNIPEPMTSTTPSHASKPKLSLHSNYHSDFQDKKKTRVPREKRKADSVRRSLKFNDSPCYDEDVINKKMKTRVNSDGKVGMKSDDSNSKEHLETRLGTMKLIEKLGDEKPVMVIKKELTPTDLNPYQIRLSMPMKQLATPEFLTKEEVQMLTEKDSSNKLKFMQVQILLPSQEKTYLKLTRWGTSNKYYVLNGSNWKTKVVKEENLVLGMEVEVWAFRVNQQLNFALLTNPNPNHPNPNPATSSP